MQAPFRRPTHAGSWYTSNPNELVQQLNGWMADAAPDDEVSAGARAVIAPHAGFSYSGPTAAWAYRHVRCDGVRRVFLLGPSHSLYTPKCLLSTYASYAVNHEAPVSAPKQIPIDQQIYDELAATGDFDEMPFIAHVMGARQYTLVPIMIGALSEAAEKRYGKHLARYLADASNLFVVSSDFCHWGERFDFVLHPWPPDARHHQIFQSIEALDREAMQLIEQLDADGFAQYQRKTGNTICGRHPIAVLLRAIQPLQPSFRLKFTRYAQSSQCCRCDESSVSYASAVVWATA